MKTIAELLRNLARPEVLEFGLVTNRLPSVNIGGKFEPVDDEAPSNERLKQMLAAMGGGRFVESLSDKPVQWTTRLDGVGIVAVAAVMRSDTIQARLTVTKREALGARSPSEGAVPVSKATSGGRPSAAPQPLASRPPEARPSQSPQPPSANVSPSLRAMAVTPSVMPRPAADVAPPPPVDDTEDDNEPTLQTRSPQVKAPAVSLEDEPRPKEPAPRAADIEPPVELLRVDASATVDAFLAMAANARASELFVVAGRPIVLRVAGDLVARTEPLSPEHVERMTRDVVPARLRAAFERDGSCDFAVEHPTHGRFRVNASRQRTGFKLNFRAVSKEVPTIEELGLPPSVVEALRWQRGLVLVTGPARQGKSTTLATIVDYLNRATAQHIMTLEDPIEHVHVCKKSLVSQRDIVLHGQSLEHVLETLHREDVDTVVIGELRAPEAIRHAMVACEAGRLVLGTMNAPSAAKAIDRILALVSAAEEPWVRERLASSLRLVVGQRLVPSADRARLHAAVEVLPWSVTLFSLIQEGRTYQIADCQRRGELAGSVCLDESLAELVRSGKVTVDAAMHLAESPSRLEGHLAAERAPAHSRRL